MTVADEERTVPIHTNNNPEIDDLIAMLLAGRTLLWPYDQSPRAAWFNWKKYRPGLRSIGLRTKRTEDGRLAVFAVVRRPRAKEDS